MAKRGGVRRPSWHSSGGTGSRPMSKGPVPVRLACTVLALVAALALLVAGFVSVSSISVGASRSEAEDQSVRDGDRHLRDGAYREALLSYQEALDANRGNVRALRGEAQAYVALGMLKEAEDCLGELKGKGPEDEDLEALAAVLVQNGEFAEAGKLVKSNPDVFEGSVYVGMDAEAKAPTFNLETGTFDAYQLLELEDGVESSWVHYTLDGSNPTVASARYQEPIPITTTTTVKAVTVTPWGQRSGVTELKLDVKREPVAVARFSEIPAGLVEDRPPSDDVFDFELAQVTELHVLGDRIQRKPFSDVSFLADGYDYMGRRFGPSGGMDLGFLAYMPYLRVLSVCYQPSFDLSLLHGKSRLRELALIHDGIKEMGGVGELTALRKLSVAYNEVADVTPLAKLQKLTTLGLWNNLVTDIGPLKGLSKLTSLDISHNQVTDISAVGSMRRLTELWVCENRVSDLAPVRGLPSLRKLMQAGNPGSDKGLGDDTLARLLVSDYGTGGE